MYVSVGMCATCVCVCWVGRGNRKIGNNESK